MNLADQIESVAWRSTAAIVAESDAFSEAQRRLAFELEMFRADVPPPPQEAQTEQDEEYYEELEERAHPNVGVRGYGE